jgi:hypothetical protein
MAFLLPLAVPAAVAAPDYMRYMRAKPQELADAYGQEVADRAFSDEFTAVRKDRIEGSLTRVGLNCPDAEFTLLDLYPFQGEPGEVIWIERYEVDCGKPLRRALLMVLSGGNIQSAAMAPGATLADPQLQIEVGPVVTASALQRAPEGCKQAPVIDTAVSKKPTGSGVPWRERWTVDACGTTLELDLDFIPSPVGGTMVRVSGD